MFSKKVLMTFFSVLIIGTSCTNGLIKSLDKQFFEKSEIIKEEINFLSSNDLRLIYDDDFQSKGILQLVNIRNGCLKLFDIQSKEFQGECFDSLLIDGNFYNGKYIGNGWVYSSGFEDEVDLHIFNEKTKMGDVLSQNFLFSDLNNGLVIGSTLDPVNYFGKILLYDLDKRSKTQIDLEANSLKFAKNNSEVAYARYDEANNSTELGILKLDTNEIDHTLKVENQALSILWGYSEGKVFLSDENRSDIFIWENKKGKITKVYSGLVLNPIVLENRKSIAFTTIENGKSFIVILPFG